MDRAGIEELFAYTDFSWREHARAISALGPKALSRSAPGSGWPALRNALGHVALAYDDWIAELTSSKMIGLDVESIDVWDDLEIYRRTVREKFRKLLESVNDDELTRIRTMDVDGEPESYSFADILANLLLHERGHHGDINTLFYQLGAEAPLVDYRFFLSATRR